MPKPLFSDFYFRLLFSFKCGPSLGLSGLMSSMFIIIIIILIIRIIKTTCFDKAILIAGLEGKVLYSRWCLSAHDIPNSVYFHEIFGNHFQKGSVCFYTKKFLPLILYFWNYNPSTNGQIVPLIDAQTHL